MRVEGNGGVGGWGGERQGNGGGEEGGEGGGEGGEGGQRCVLIIGIWQRPKWKVQASQSNVVESPLLLSLPPSSPLPPTFPNPSTPFLTSSSLPSPTLLLPSPSPPFPSFSSPTSSFLSLLLQFPSSPLLPPPPPPPPLALSRSVKECQIPRIFIFNLRLPGNETE